MSRTTSGKKVILNSVIYTASGLLLKCFSFLLLPLYTAYLTTEDYGITSIAGSFASVMGFVVAFSLFSAVLRFYVDLKDDPEKLKRFYGTIVSFVFLSSCFWCVLLTIFRSVLEKYIFVDVDFYPVIMICLLSFIFNTQHTIYTNILRSQQKAMTSSMLSIIFFFFTLGMNILFVVVFKMGAVGVLLATLITDIVFFVVFLVHMFKLRAIKFCLDGALLKSALKYSIPIMPHNLSSHIAVFISKILIGDTTSLASLGVYSVASQFGHVADTIQSHVDNAFGPWLYEKLNAKEQDYQGEIRQLSKMLIGVIGLFFVGIALFAHDYIVLFIDHAYVYAWKYVAMIMLVFAIKTAYYFYVEVLFYYKKASKLLFTATFTGSLVNILLSAVMIPAWGVEGSIFADAIAMIARVGIVIVISKRYGDIGLHLKDFIFNYVLVAGFICLGLSLSYFRYPESFSWLDVGYKMLVTLGYVGVLLMNNRKQLAAIFRRLHSKRMRKDKEYE